MHDNCCAFAWEKGMFVIVDNHIAYHSRQVYEGKRRVFASVGKGTKKVKDCGQTALVLKSGDKMPSVGLGCWKIPKDQTAECVFNAI